jgi:hypothetical protein
MLVQVAEANAAGAVFPMEKSAGIGILALHLSSKCRWRPAGIPRAGSIF